MPFDMDSYTGMSNLQNQIQHKNQVMIVKTVFLHDVWTPIRRNFSLKLQKVDKSDAEMPKLWWKHLFSTYQRNYEELRQRTGKRFPLS